MATRIEKLLEAAEAHGENSEPDHEVGDLREMLQDAWKLMTEEQRGKLYPPNHLRDRNDPHTLP